MHYKRIRRPCFMVVPRPFNGLSVNSDLNVSQLFQLPKTIQNNIIEVRPLLLCISHVAKCFVCILGCYFSPSRRTCVLCPPSAPMRCGSETKQDVYFKHDSLILHYVAFINRDTNTKSGFAAFFRHRSI